MSWPRPLRTAGPAGSRDVPPPAPRARRIGRAPTYEEPGVAPVRARTHDDVTAPRPPPVGDRSPGIRASVFPAVLCEEAKSCSAMADALAAVTLPAVVEELLSEMAAAVQESARSTGQRGACVAVLCGLWTSRRRAGRREAVVSACGALDSGLRSRAPCPGLPALFSPCVSISKPPPLSLLVKQREKS